MGLSGFAVVATGAIVGGRAWWKHHQMKKIPVKESENPKDMLPPEVTKSPTPSDDYLPWWTGVSEVSIYFNKENAEAIDSHFESAHPVKCP